MLRLLLNKPMHLQRQLVYISCMTKFQHKISSWHLCHRMCRCTFRVGRFQFSSPSYEEKHHILCRIYQQFQPSWYAWPKIKTQIYNLSSAKDFTILTILLLCVDYLKAEMKKRRSSINLIE